MSTNDINARRTAQIGCKSRRLRRKDARQGAVAVEFAITFGLALLFFFSALEFCRVAMIRGTVDNALYEGTRVAIVPGSTNADAENAARRVLSSIGVRNVVLTSSPNPLRATSPTVRVDISVPLDQNLFAPAIFFRGKSITRTFEMQRETSRL